MLLAVSAWYLLSAPCLLWMTEGAPGHPWPSVLTRHLMGTQGTHQYDMTVDLTCLVDETIAGSFEFRYSNYLKVELFCLHLNSKFLVNLQVRLAL